ncbi:RraA family protein [Streptomyces tendae]
MTPAGPFKDGPGTVGAPVAVGGTVVAPGDVLVGDADGVVVVPRRRVTEVVAAVDGIAEKEDALRGRILAARQGRTAVAR